MSIDDTSDDGWRPISDGVPDGMIYLATEDKQTQWPSYNGVTKPQKDWPEPKWWRLP